MPLKHSTETLLVFLLGVAIIIAGVACALLPPPMNAPWPWAIAFALSIAYPLSLYPLFKERRADYSFRALHFVPAGMLLVWFLLQLLIAYRPSVAPAAHWYIWGWSLPVVILAFLALTWFCFTVIRQWSSRLLLLALILVPFLFIGVAGEQYQWPEQLASVLWQKPHSTGSGVIIVGTVTGNSNLSRSANESEEKWRAELRRMERRTSRLARLQNQPTSVHSAMDGVMISASSSSEMIAVVVPPKNKPPHLPSSGMGTEVLAMMMVAVYCGVLHQRARRRVFRYS